MDALLLYIGIIGNIISVLVFASPIKTFWRIVRSRSTEDFDPAPYVVTLLSSSFWVYYGITKPDGFLVATVNSFGVIMETIYVSLFLIFASNSQLRTKTFLMVVFLDIGLLGAIVLATRLVAVDENLRVSVIGTICALLNVFMYGAPLAILKTVIDTRSVEYMPFLLSFFLFLNGGIWTLYAVIDGDFFLGILNGIGCLLGLVQLLLCVFYRTTRTSKAAHEGERSRQPLIVSNGTSRRDEEEG